MLGFENCLSLLPATLAKEENPQRTHVAASGDGKALKLLLLLVLHVPHTTNLLPGGQAGGRRRRRHRRPVYRRVPVEEAVQASSDSVERRGWKVRSICSPHRGVEALQELTGLQEETRGKRCQGAHGRKGNAGGEDVLWTCSV